MEAAGGGVGREAGGRGFPRAKVPAGPQTSHIHAHHTTASPLATKALHTRPVQLESCLFPWPALPLEQPEEEGGDCRGGKLRCGPGLDLCWTFRPGHPK